MYGIDHDMIMNKLKAEGKTKFNVVKNAELLLENFDTMKDDIDVLLDNKLIFAKLKGEGDSDDLHDYLLVEDFTNAGELWVTETDFTESECTSYTGEEYDLFLLDCDLLYQLVDVENMRYKNEWYEEELIDKLRWEGIGE